MQKITKRKPDIDEIEEVKKFNPFHDAAGKFASSNGFKSYSANPNTRAGAMAIARSAAAGHGKTLNVHRQSYGENIRQNANWLGQGKQVKPGQKGNATLRSRVEPAAGLGGASATGASWQAQNAAQGRVTSAPKNPPTPKQQQASQQANPASGYTVSSSRQGYKLQGATISHQGSNPKSVQGTKHTIANGKDISGTVHVKSGSGSNSAINQVADAQGFRGKPKVVSKKEFDSACKQTGIVMYRTVNHGTDVVTGKQVQSKHFADLTMKGDGSSFSLNGSGGQIYGGGMYATMSKGTPGTIPNGKRALGESQAYGRSGATTMSMTLDPTAKIGDFSALRREFANEPYSTQQKFGNDIGAYACAKGYDGLRAKNAGYSCDYVTVFNRTKLIICEDTQTK